MSNVYAYAESFGMSCAMLRATYPVDLPPGNFTPLTPTQDAALAQARVDEIANGRRDPAPVPTTADADADALVRAMLDFAELFPHLGSVVAPDAARSMLQSRGLVPGSMVTL